MQQQTLFPQWAVWIRLALCLSFALTLAACQSQPGRGANGEQLMVHAYEAGDYATAYDLARDRRYGGTAEERSYAEYIAGMSAWKMGEHAKATKHLEGVRDFLSPRQTAQDRTDYGEVSVILGMIYAEQALHGTAANRFMQGAPYLTGEDQANAYFYAGASLQKRDRQPEAVTQFRLARAATTDADLRSRIDRFMQATGFTLQFGAFSNRANANQLAGDIARKTRSMGLGAPSLVTAVDQRTGKTVTLVQLGLFTDYRSANQARLAIGDEAAIIVQRNGRVS